MSRSTRPFTQLALAVVVFLAAGCSPESSASPMGSSGPSVPAVPLDAALEAIRQMPGDFSCADPIPRQDDFAWICEGSREPVTATIHLYATQVGAPVFGVTLYTSAPSSVGQGAAADATQQLALDLVNVAVPEPWRDATRSWVTGHMQGGGRTLDVPNAGITAAVQPLTGLQWYLEFYELDGLQH
jgi:hypothetical protein